MASYRALQFLTGKSNLPVTSSQRALQYLYLYILIPASQPLYISNKVQFRALQFLAGKSELPVTSSERALQLKTLQFLAGKSNLAVTSSKRALQYLALYKT